MFRGEKCIYYALSIPSLSSRAQCVGIELSEGIFKTFVQVNYRNTLVMYNKSYQESFPRSIGCSMVKNVFNMPDDAIVQVQEYKHSIPESR